MSRRNTSRFDILKKASVGNCVEGCGRLWITSALEVLEYNRIHPVLFANSIRDLLIQGRGKFRNMLIVGPANCAKTFLLKPLEKIYECFTSPAKDKYCWVGADESEVILLQEGPMLIVKIRK